MSPCSAAIEAGAMDRIPAPVRGRRCSSCKSLIVRRFTRKEPETPAEFGSKMRWSAFGFVLCAIALAALVSLFNWQFPSPPDERVAVAVPRHANLSAELERCKAVDSISVERDAGGKPLHTFPHPAPRPGDPDDHACGAAWAESHRRFFNRVPQDSPSPATPAAPQSATSGDARP